MRATAHRARDYFPVARISSGNFSRPTPVYPSAANAVGSRTPARFRGPPGIWTPIVARPHAGCGVNPGIPHVGRRPW